MFRRWNVMGGEGCPGFKGPVVGPPCDLMRILGDLLVWVIVNLSRIGLHIFRDALQSLRYRASIKINPL